MAQAISDLNEVSSRQNNLVIPFSYLPQLSANSLLFNQNFDDSNFNLKSLTTSCFYYANIADCNNENEATTTSTKSELLKTNLEHDYFYHNCLVESLFKLYARSLSDKFLLAKYLVTLMPYNCDLIKLLVNFSKKINGLLKTLQLLYDHVCVHSIESEQLVSIQKLGPMCMHSTEL